MSHSVFQVVARLQTNGTHGMRERKDTTHPLGRVVLLTPTFLDVDNRARIKLAMHLHPRLHAVPNSIFDDLLLMTAKGVLAGGFGPIVE